MLSSAKSALGGKKVLITGAGGFAGTHLTKELQHNSDYEVYGSVYQSTSDISSLLGQDHILAGDLTDFNYAQTLVQTVKPDIVYHLAALSVVHNSVDNAVKVINGNAAISYNLLEAVRLSAPKARFMAICSANVYGAIQNPTTPINESTPFRPLNPYAVSKITQEMLALEYYLSYGLDVVIIRPFNHTGVGQTTDFVVPSLAKQFIAIEQGGEPTIAVGNLDNVRDFTDVRDMVGAYAMASDKCLSGEAYNIGSGRGYSVREIIGIFEKILGKKVELHESKTQQRSSDVPILVADASKFVHATHWKPNISLETTISDILESYRR